MPIRTVPWDERSLADVQALIDLQIPESRTLEYKETLNLDDSGRLDFLQDVTAMANAAGGTIVYGAVEGEGADRGLLVRYQGMAIDPEKVGLQLNHLLQHGVDERMQHVLHGPITVAERSYLYVVRIPPSPRAPHMVIVKSARPRFYSRATISNDPMNMQQIRDAVLRSDSVVERARSQIEARTADALAFAAEYPNRHDPLDDSVVLLHVIPLYQATEGVDLAAQRTADRMKGVRGYGARYEGNLRWTLEGLYNQYQSDGVTRRNWALYNRDGALEFGQVGFRFPPEWAPDQKVRTIDVQSMDTDVRDAVEQAKQLAQAGWFTPPFVLSLRLLNVQGSLLTRRRSITFGNDRRLPSEHLMVEPEVVNDWDAGLERALLRMFNTVWQAFGYQRCFLYDEEGRRVESST